MRLIPTLSSMQKAARGLESQQEKHTTTTTTKSTITTSFFPTPPTPHALFLFFGFVTDPLRLIFAISIKPSCSNEANIARLKAFGPY